MLPLQSSLYSDRKSLCFPIRCKTQSPKALCSLRAARIRTPDSSNIPAFGDRQAPFYGLSLASKNALSPITHSIPTKHKTIGIDTTLPSEDEMLRTRYLCLHSHTAIFLSATERTIYGLLFLYLLKCFTMFGDLTQTTDKAYADMK